EPFGAPGSPAARRPDLIAQRDSNPVATAQRDPNPVATAQHSPSPRRDCTARPESGRAAVEKSTRAYSPVDRSSPEEPAARILGVDSPTQSCGQKCAVHSLVPMLGFRLQEEQS